MERLQRQHEEDTERRKWQHEELVNETNAAIERGQEQMRQENMEHLQEAAREFLDFRETIALQQRQINALMHQMQSHQGIAAAPLPESSLLEGPHPSTHTVEGAHDNGKKSGSINVIADDATP